MLKLLALLSAMVILLLIGVRHRARQRSRARGESVSPGHGRFLLAGLAALLTLVLALLEPVEGDRELTPVQKATHLLHVGRPAAALAEIRPALDRRPADGALNALRGEALIQLGRLVEAREALERAREDPDLAGSTGLLLSLGFSMDRLGRPADALEVALEVLGMEPENLAGLVLASRALMALGQVPRALYHARQATLIAPEDPMAVANRARIEARAGQLDEARSTADRARELGYPLWEPLQEALPRLAGTPAPGEPASEIPRRSARIGLGLMPPPGDAAGGPVQDGLQIKIWSESPRYRLGDTMNVWIALTNHTGRPYSPSYFFESELAITDDRGQTRTLEPINPVSGVPAYGLSLGIFGDLEDAIQEPGRYMLSWTLGPLESNRLVLIVDPR